MARMSQRVTRQWLMQGVYQWGMTAMSAEQVVEALLADNPVQQPVVDLFALKDKLRDIIGMAAELDALYQPYLQEQSVEELTAVERAILRVGSYELKCSLACPVRVVLHEATELAKQFGAAEAHKFVNAVLDRLAHVLRAEELAG